MSSDGPAPDSRFSYREQTIRPLCVSCRDEAHTSCPRCGAPHCAAHQPSATLRCARCEAFYTTARAHRHRNPLPAWALATLYLLVATGGAGLSWLASTRDWLVDTRIAIGWALLLVVTVGLLPLWVAMLRLSRLRRTFLQEAPGRRRLATPDVELDAPAPPASHETLAVVAASFSGVAFLPFVAPVTGMILALVSISMALRERAAPSRTALVALALHIVLLISTFALFAAIW